MKTKLILSLLALAACEDSAASRENASVERNQSALQAAVPAPTLHDSQERRNLVRRLNLVNNPNRVSWIHLLGRDGRVVFYTSVRGKVSSLNSYLTATQQIRHTGNAEHVVEAPDLDGTYGENPNGIFWFTEDGVYMEWNGEYLLSDRPLRLSQEPTMVMQVNGRGNPTQ